MERCSLISCGVLALALSASTVVVVVVAGDWERLAKASLGGAGLRPLSKDVTEPSGFERDEKRASGPAEDRAGTVGEPPRRLSSNSSVPACGFTASSETVTAELDRYSLEAKFNCGLDEEANTIQPDCKQTATTNCCQSGGDACTRTILDAVGVKGSASVDAQSHIVTVRLEETPKNTGEKLYFKCTKNAGNTCIVTVNMPEPLQASECNFDKNVELPSISKPNTSATFQCGGPVEPKPTQALVFKGEACTGPPSKLEDLVPGAKLTEDPPATYTLKVAALPTETQNLCFQCVYPDPRQKKEKQNATAVCKVTVAVNGGGSDSSKTTTASTTASSAKGIAVTWSAFLTLGLVGTA